MINQIQAYIIGITAIISTFIGVWFRGKQSGINQAEARNNEQILQNAKEAKEVEIEVDAMSDDAARDELRKHWTID